MNPTYVNYIFKKHFLYFTSLTHAVDGCCIFFYVTPLQYHPIKISFWLLSIILWSVVVPLILYFILKKIKLVQSIDLKTSKERIWPLLLNSIILGYLSFSLLPESICVELHYLFLGALITAALGMILALLKFKTSIHMMSTGGAFFFMVLLICIMVILLALLLPLCNCYGCNGKFTIAFKCTYPKELVAGLFVGVVPQLLLLITGYKR